MMKSIEREYFKADSAAFLKTTEKWGKLSNMARGFPLAINGYHIANSEALYQACRFPHRPDIQEKIITQKNPMDAKSIARHFDAATSEDWMERRVFIMKWCLRVKLAQNWDAFSKELLATQDLHIVEISFKDKFWGATPVTGDRLLGQNVLGRLLMELREQIKIHHSERFWTVLPPKLDNFLLLGQEIGRVYKYEASKVTDSTFQSEMF
ncbi:TPA: NADAR family protein [Vibrio parahaemolyticus]|uniref:NADAR family protein n=1 Tax=Vibrio nigripulchritudo TaxID=28173 RepID=UPI00249034BC|nr:NADAR family protein [Vibrio nigripulchritudo]BDU38107.1 hypothetical protein TUMSATVNIG2_25760 [Vibrio nigripulchritudo]BDU43830.1 hypothetical protein TUMSATVNIG3_26280 [Vibrio nigripulchritudo]HCE3019797.1 NADAR family protein [Vibrio parahaemolyticus]HCE4479454.1 NADAR family protein [Vibrio parahaemolyticus]